MKLYWKQAVSTMMIASTVVLAVSPAFAADEAVLPVSIVMPTYGITDVTQTQVKSVLLEKTPGGWRIGSVVKLINASGAAVRIPDYELRAKAADGTVYTLQPSAGNAKSISPQSSVELSYMLEIDAQSEISLTDLLWIDVNMNVYPKQETVLADAPVGNIVWRGSDAVIDDASLLNWGQSFTLPGVISALTYSASSFSTQYNGQSPVYTIQMKVNNPGSYTETVPDFTLSGKAAGQSFIGKRVEQTPIGLNPGESQYVHYTVTADPGVKLDALYVLLSETFLKQGQTVPQQYYTGRIGFRLPTGDTGVVSLPVYEPRSRIAIDPISQAVNPLLSVSLTNVEWFENEGQSFKTAIAHLKLSNNSDSPLPVPELAADMLNAQGVAYTGSRLASSVKEVLPGMGVDAVYAFSMPNSETGERFTFRLLEPQGKEGLKSPIAQLNVGVEKAAPNPVDLVFYPYQLKLNSWALSNIVSQNATTKNYNYTYSLKTGMDISTTDNVVTEASNPKLFIQLENASGQRIAYKSFSLSGPDRLMSGSQIMYFDNVSTDQMEAPLTVKIFETVTTPLGEAKRLLSVLQQ